MYISELLTRRKHCFSFEFFPPKNQTGLDQLRETILALRDLNPTFVSVTYGAGGTTRDLTVDLVTEIKRDYGIEAMAHLTCVGSSRNDIHQVLERLHQAGIENVLTLRGDPPKGETSFVRHADGFGYANELAEFVQSSFPFCMAGACYPEMHIEAESMDRDLENLRRKVDNGVSFLVTQLFFDNRRYFDFVDSARKAGIKVPIIPGIMPITNLAQVERFTKMCGASIPQPLFGELDRLRDQPEAVLSLGVAHATAQCLELLQNGAPGIHFYTLNRSAATRMILTVLRSLDPRMIEG